MLPLALRYIFKTLFKITLVITLVLSAIIWLTQSLHFLELLVSSGAPIGLFMKLILLSLPHFIEVIIPVAFTAAIIFTYNRMIMDNELTALRSCGLSALSLAKPALILGCAFSVGLFIFSAWVAPKAHNTMLLLRQSMQAEYSSFLLREGVFNPIGKQLTVYLRRRGQKGELHGLLIHDTREKDAPPVTIMAKRGIIVMEENGPKVVVYDGNRQQFDPKTQSLSRLHFDRYTLEIKDFKKQILHRWRESNERSLGELFTPDTSNKYDRMFARQFIGEAHQRIVAPFLPLNHALIALACLLTGGFSRRGQGRRIMLAIGLILCLQVSHLGVASIAKQKNWAIVLLYLLSAIPLFVSFFLLQDKGGRFLRSLQKTFSASLNTQEEKQL